MGLFDPMNVSASGLTAERLRLDLVANNLANANTTRTPGGGPYRRQLPVFMPGGVTDGLLGGTGHVVADGAGDFATAVAFSGGTGQWAAGVHVAGIVSDPTPGPVRYDPASPDAGPDGYVALPNVNPTAEMVDLVAASRAYQANVTAFNAGKDMFSAGLDIARG